ncbi:MAG: prolyl oligopeptidase family serine peptidase [Bacteroidales bacterium]|nr:prolyl oligopeptidase family serine peptidase [Bacteroidales bacterium]
MKRISTLFALLLLSAALCAQDLHVFESENLHCNDSVLVFSPSKAAKVRNLPTVMVLHGYGGDYRNWSRRMDLQSFADRTGFRIICPDGFIGSWYIDDADKSKMQWMTFFEKELYPGMDKEYGLDPQKTFITGLSMGGHGAMTIFLSHQEWFRAGGSMSGVLDIRNREKIAAQLGTSVEGHVLYDHSAVSMVDNIKGTGKFCIVTCGTEDSLVRQARAFEEVCHEAGVPCISMYSPGKHNWKYWPYALEYHVGWFSRILNGESLGF